MTPEAWNLGGSLLLALIGFVMLYSGWRIEKGTDYDGCPQMILGFILFLFGMILVVENWGPFGTAMFGGGR